MSTVEVLNASYERLGTTKVPRAIALVNNGRAVVDEHYEDRFLRSVGGLAIPFPKVIRLLTYINVPFDYSEEHWSKTGVLNRDSHTCGYCLASADTVDHVVPKSRYAERTQADTWMNTVASCQRCNFTKADRTPEEAGMVLQTKPYIPMKVYLRSPKRHKKSKNS